MKKNYRKIKNSYSILGEDNAPKIYRHFSQEHLI